MDFFVVVQEEYRRKQDELVQNYQEFKGLFSKPSDELDDSNPFCEEEDDKNPFKEAAQEDDYDKSGKNPFA